jgi:hypothetical protein
MLARFQFSNAGMTLLFALLCGVVGVLLIRRDQRN